MSLKIGLLACLTWVVDIINTYSLGAREAVFFVILRPAMFPVAQPSKKVIYYYIKCQSERQY